MKNEIKPPMPDKKHAHGANSRPAPPDGSAKQAHHSAKNPPLGILTHAAAPRHAGNTVEGVRIKSSRNTRSPQTPLQDWVMPEKTALLVQTKTK
jgi:hypothetical protein